MRNRKTAEIYPPKTTGQKIPPEPVGFEFGMMKKIYEADLKRGAGTSFWMDRLLERKGKDPSLGTCGGMMSRGRAFYMNYHDQTVIGFGGEAAYIEESETDFGFSPKSGKPAYSVTFSLGDAEEDVKWRKDFPSHWHGKYKVSFLDVNVTKFITENNSAVTLIDISNSSADKIEFTLNAASPFASKQSGDELVGSFCDPFENTEIYPRFSGDGLAPCCGTLKGEFEIEAGECVSIKLIMGFIAPEIPESAKEYLEYKKISCDKAFVRHVRHYNKWWAENIPYFDTEDEALKKAVYYEWWKLRFNMLDANAAKNYPYPTFLEGCLGYNNAITLSVPWHMDDAKYLKNPLYVYGTWQSVAETAKDGLYISNPGDPKHWPGWNIAHYISKAGWEAYKVHGGPKDFLRFLAESGEKDVRANLRLSCTKGSFLLGRQYDGWDADTLSNTYAKEQERLDSTAYTWANALAVSEMYGFLGEADKSKEMFDISQRMLEGMLDNLWDEESRQFLHKTMDGQFIPWRDINNYYQWLVDMIPEWEEKYPEALKPWANEDEFSIWPMYISHRKDYEEALGEGKNLTPNYGFGNIGITLKLFARAIKKYKSEYILPKHFEKLLKWTVWAHYVNGDINWPDTNEFFRGWDGEKIGYRSWIHHNALGRFNAEIFENVVGITPREDEIIELHPIDIDMERFTADGIRYHDRELSVAWISEKCGADICGGVPKGYSLFVDGKRVMTADKLAHVMWNPATGEVIDADGAGIVPLFSCAYEKLGVMGDSVTQPADAEMFFIKAAQRSMKIMLPSVPGKLEATASSCTQINVLWSASAGADHYILEADGEEICGVQSPFEYTCLMSGSRHKFRIRAANQAGKSGWSGSVSAKLPECTGENLALCAKASASEKCSGSWFSLDGLNDGYDPKQAADYSHKTYYGKNISGSQWVKYEWPNEVKVKSCDIYWFDDGLDAAVPEACDFYFLSDSKWVKAPEKNEIGFDAGKYNSVEFVPFETTAIKIEITQKAGFAAGIQEWKVFGGFAENK